MFLIHFKKTNISFRFFISYAKCDQLLIRLEAKGKKQMYDIQLKIKKQTLSILFASLGL